MARQRKTRDEYRVWLNYGQGWEHETSEDSAREAVAQVRTYRENCPEYPAKWTGPHRVAIEAAQ